MKHAKSLAVALLLWAAACSDPGSAALFEVAPKDLPDDFGFIL